MLIHDAIFVQSTIPPFIPEDIVTFFIFIANLFATFFIYSIMFSDWCRVTSLLLRLRTWFVALIVIWYIYKLYFSITPCRCIIIANVEVFFIRRKTTLLWFPQLWVAEAHWAKFTCAGPHKRLSAVKWRTSAVFLPIPTYNVRMLQMASRSNNLPFKYCVGHWSYALYIKAHLRHLFLCVAGRNSFRYCSKKEKYQYNWPDHSQECSLNTISTITTLWNS